MFIYVYKHQHIFMFVYVADIGFYNYEDHIGNSEYDSLPSSYGDFLNEFD